MNEGRKPTGQPEKRVVLSTSTDRWGIDCPDCGAVLVRASKPVDTTLWEHELQQHQCNDYYFTERDYLRHERVCSLAHDRSRRLL